MQAQSLNAQALTWYEQALDVGLAEGDTAGVAQACANLGACYNSMGQYAQALAWNEQARAAYAAVGDTAGFGRGPRIWNTRDCMLLRMHMHGNMGQYPPPPPAGVDYASAPEAGAAYGSRSVTPEQVRTNDGALVFRRQNPGPLLGNVFSSIPPPLPPLPLYAAGSYGTRRAEWGENPASDEDARGDVEERAVLERRGDTRPVGPAGVPPDWYAKRRGT